ncbi:MAG: ABC-F family ATP-binding cassette domain-containing protein [Vallitaleaceae bacterium]|nr:ABC-F family ATP-binding cassette domain-containing protein [Vallitaleaceae bacterium]
MILSCQNIEFSYTYDKILDGVSFHVNEKEHTAIVGINGAGKTTLFKILTGQLTPDSGNIFLSNNLSYGYLAQHIDVSSLRTVYDEMYSANERIIELGKKLQAFEKTLNQIEHPSVELLHDYHEAQIAFENLDGYSYESNVRGILKGLGFSEEQHQQIVNTLSGGQKTRLALGKLLLIQPELLLLDEPTNHLDLNAIRWLESYLTSYKGTLLLISHDRYFLDRICKKIVDIEQGKAAVYSGNYSDFIQKKEFAKEVEEKHYEQQQQEIKRQEEVIRKLRSFSQEKFIKRAQSREKVLERMERMDKPISLRNNMHLHLDPKKESGMDVLRISDLAMAFEQKEIFRSLNLDIYRGDKIALVGKNGSGKTTLLKILMGDIKPTQGHYKIGSSVEIAYYDQEHSLLNEEFTLIEEISEDFPSMDISQIRNLLAAFLFTQDEPFKTVSALSGGEKGRLSLAKLMLSKGNFLLLDEPTNHLDMISKEVLENALSHYSGTIFFISHDRYFINRVATKVVELTENGLNVYHGNYDYYVEKKNEEKQLQPSQEEASLSANKIDWLDSKAQLKEDRKLKNRILKLENRITKLESLVEDINHRLTQEEVFSNYQKTSELMNERDCYEEELLNAMEEWESLHE